MEITKVQFFAYLFVLSLGIDGVNSAYCYGRTNSYTAYTYSRTITPYIYYPNNHSCQWIIRASSSLMAVQLSFTSFNLESSSYCNNDYLTVYDGSTTLSPIIGKYCGSTRPPTIVSKEQYLYLKFKSNLYTNGLGFTMSFKAVYHFSLSTTRCSSLNTFANNNAISLTASSGDIYSPSYPGYYPDNMQCTWKIAVPSGKKIKLYFNYISIAWSGSCTNDYLRIRDGYSSTSTLKGDYCGTTRRTIYSSGRYLWIRFRSNHITGAKGFQLRYTAESSSSSSNGVIVGVILGIAVIVGVIVAVIYCTKRKRPGVVHHTTAPSAVTTTTVTTAHPAPAQNVGLQPMHHAPPPYEYPQKVPPGPGYGGPPPMGGPGYAGPPPAGGPGYAGPTGGPGSSAYPPPASGPGYPGPPPQGYQGPPPNANYPGPPLVGGPGPPPVV